MARRRKGVRLEMTALLDVMFLVLVFFIYSIFDMAVHRGVKVDLPSAAGAEERTAVIVSGDRSASLGAGIEILSDLKARGVRRVSFQVSGASAK